MEEKKNVCIAIGARVYACTDFSRQMIINHYVPRTPRRTPQGNRRPHCASTPATPRMPSMRDMPGTPGMTSLPATGCGRSLAATAAAALALVACGHLVHRAGSLGAEMVPVAFALALLFINGYGMLSVSPKHGWGPRAAFILAILIGATFVPSAAAISRPSPRSAAVLRAWRGSGSKANPPTDGAEDLQKFSRSPTTGGLPAFLSLRGGGADQIHSHKFKLRGDSTFESTTTKDGDKVKARFVVEGRDVEALTLHWGVAVKSDSEWITPQKINCEDIIPHNSILYKDRAIRTRLERKGDKLELVMTIPASSKILGIRFVLWEHDKDNWFPGGVGGNYYVPLNKAAVDGKRRREGLQRSPSWYVCTHMCMNSRVYV